MQWRNKYIVTHIVYSTMSVTVCAMYTLWDWDMCARCAAPAAKWLRQPIVTSINGRWVGGWSPQDYKPDHGNIVGHFTRNDKKVQNIVKMVPILLTTAISLLLGKPSWEKKCFLSGIARKGGGRGDPCPNFLTLFSTMLSLIFWHQYMPCARSLLPRGESLLIWGMARLGSTLG